MRTGRVGSIFDPASGPVGTLSGVFEADGTLTDRPRDLENEDSDDDDSMETEPTPDTDLDPDDDSDDSLDDSLDSIPEFDEDDSRRQLDQLPGDVDDLPDNMSVQATQPQDSDILLTSHTELELDPQGTDSLSLDDLMEHLSSFGQQGE